MFRPGLDFMKLSWEHCVKGRAHLRPKQCSKCKNLRANELGEISEWKGWVQGVHFKKNVS
jgi:hypothetical protein